MYDENQLIAMRWSTSNKTWYESFGYKYTKCRDYFTVKVKYLPPHSSAKINVQCDYCGLNYKSQYSLILNGRKTIKKDCCSFCAGKKSSEISHHKRAEKYMSLANNICQEHGYKLITSVNEYTNVKMPVKFYCPEHGVQTMMLENFLHSNYVVSIIDAVNDNKLLNADEYKDAVTPNLQIKCGLCGNEFATSLANYTKAGVNRCHSCSCKESSGEACIRNLLNLKNIAYIQEKRFEDCRDKKPLPFDFYLPEYNLVIEFDGQHHYSPIYGEEHFYTTKLHDKIKDDYCIIKGIELLRIPYWDGNNIEEIIIDKLNVIGKRYSLVS